MLRRLWSRGRNRGSSVTSREGGRGNFLVAVVLRVSPNGDNLKT